MLNVGLMACIVLAVGLPTVGVDAIVDATAPAERTLKLGHDQDAWVVVKGLKGDILYEAPFSVLEDGDEEYAVCASYTDPQHNQAHETACEAVTNCWSGTGIGVCKYAWFALPPVSVWSCECTVSPE